MTSCRVVFTPEALAHLAELYRTIAEAASPERAEHYVGALVTRCESLGYFPARYRRRDDIRPGLRAASYRRRTTIVFHLGESDVTIIGVFHGGRDYERALSETQD